MNGTNKMAMKSYLITFGIALIANVVAGIVVAKFIFKNEEKQLAKSKATSSTQQISIEKVVEPETNG